MGVVYTVVAYLLAPILLLNWLLRGWRERGYWRHLGERAGFGRRLAPGALWLHAVSAGEVQASAPLVALLQRQRPSLPLVVTTATPAGRARALALFPAADVRYLPIDLPGAVARFFHRVRPSAGVIVETELWPHLYARAARTRVPVVVASARLSARSAARYAVLPGLTRRTLHGVSVAAQTELDAARFIAIGADPARTRVTGNLKFDHVPRGTEAAQAWRSAFAGRPVWVAGSTHPVEEDRVLAAHCLVRQSFPDALLVLVPRHPPRFAEVEAALVRDGIACAVRRGPGPLPPLADASVLLIATLGELECAYAAGDVAFVGGSLVPVGGHNLLEPALAGRPVLFGPSHATARAMADVILGAGGGAVVADEAALGAALLAYFRAPETREIAGNRARAAVAGSRGAAARTAALVEAVFDEAGLARPAAEPTG